MKSEDIDDGLHFPFVNFINTGNADITAFICSEESQLCQFLKVLCRIRRKSVSFVQQNKKRLYFIWKGILTRSQAKKVLRLLTTPTDFHKFSFKYLCYCPKVK